YIELQGGLLLSSMVGAIVAHPSYDADFNDVALAELVGVSLAGHSSTPYLGVCALPPATTLVQDGSGTVRVHTHWKLELNESDDTESFDAASERLQELLANAITERRATSGPTSIWLSGGYDSPVMFAVGNAALDRQG